MHFANDVMSKFQVFKMTSNVFKKIFLQAIILLWQVLFLVHFHTGFPRKAANTVLKNKLQQWKSDGSVSNMVSALNAMAGADLMNWFPSEFTDKTYQ
jgi:hypothetical protein